MMPMVSVLEGSLLKFANDFPYVVDEVGEQDCHKEHHEIAVDYLLWVFGSEVSIPNSG